MTARGPLAVLLPSFLFVASAELRYAAAEELVLDLRDFLNRAA